MKVITREDRKSIASIQKNTMYKNQRKEHVPRWFWLSTICLSKTKQEFATYPTRLEKNKNVRQKIVEIHHFKTNKMVPFGEEPDASFLGSC